MWGGWFISSIPLYAQPSVAACSSPQLLIDVSRLVQRRRIGWIATGIDRVCGAYLSRYAGNARAVIRWMRFIIVFNHADTHILAGILDKSTKNIFWQLLRFLPGAVIRSLFSPVPDGSIYLNLGHTGLDSPCLLAWVKKKDLHAVYFIHDIIPITHQEYCRAGSYDQHFKRMMNVFDSASQIITNSQHTREEIIALASSTGMRPPPIIVSQIAGLSEHLSGQAVSADLGRPYFLCVGTIEARKNHILLLEVWQELAKQMGDAAPLLVLVGQRGWEADHVFTMLDNCPYLQSYLIELGSCEDAELAMLLKGARALLLPSFTEGFGLPVVEALQAGTPLILSDLPVFREIAGTIPLYLDCFDRAAWQEAILDFLADSAERRRQLEELPTWRVPNWQSHFDKVDHLMIPVEEKF